MVERIDKHRIKKELYKHNTTVCGNLRLLRLLNNYTQAQIAELLNLSLTAYYSVEVGKKIPDFDLLIILSDFYNVSIDYIVSFDIADQMLNMIKSEQTETRATRFIERFFCLSYSGKEQIRKEVFKMKEFEDRFRNFPWQYEELPELYSPCILVDKRKEIERSKRKWL